MKKFWKNFNLVGFLMLMLGVVLGVGDVSGAVFANGGYVQKEVGSDGNPVVTQPTTVETDASTVINHHKYGILETHDIRALRPDMIKDPIDKMIVKMRPSIAPLDTIMRYAKSSQVNSFEFEWMSSDIRPVSATVTSMEDENKNVDYTVVSVTLKVPNVNLFSVTDTITVPGVKGQDGSDLMLYVYDVDTKNNEFTATCPEDQMLKDSNNVLSVPNIPNGTEIYRMARAAAELDMQTPAWSSLPTKSKGYAQIFKWQITQSTYSKLLNKGDNLDFDLSEIEEQGLYEFRLALEASYLFGHKSKIWDPIKRTPIYTTDGIINQITNHFDIDITDKEDGNEQLIALSRQIFTGNTGAETRIMFAGSGFVEKLSSISSVQKQVDAGNTEVVWGMEWKTIKTNFGTLLLMPHALFDLYGWEYKAVILDTQFIDKKVVEGMNGRDLDLKSPGIANADAKVWTEAAGLALKYLSTHATVGLTIDNGSGSIVSYEQYLKSQSA